MADEAPIEVVDDREKRRFEIRVDGELAGFADYSRRGGRLIFRHTEIDDGAIGLPHHGMRHTSRVGRPPDNLAAVIDVERLSALARGTEETRHAVLAPCDRYGRDRWVRRISPADGLAQIVD